MKTHLLFLLTAALLCNAGAMAADGMRSIDERRPLKADARVSVSNVAGLIEVEAWNKNELHLTGTLDGNVEELVIEGDASRLEIEVKVPRRSRRTGDTILKLKVPAGSSLKASGVSADIRVKGIKGRVETETVSGDITLDVAAAKVLAESVSGDIELDAPASDVRVATVSGDVTARGGRGALRAESVSGRVRMQAKDVATLDAESVSGDLDLDLDLARNAEVSVETLSGEVTLTLPSLPDLPIDIETFSGEIVSAFPGIADQKGSRRGAEPPRAPSPMRSPQPPMPPAHAGDMRAADSGHPMGAPRGRDDDEDDEHEDAHGFDSGRKVHREGKGEGSLQIQSFSGDIILKKR